MTALLRTAPRERLLLALLSAAVAVYLGFLAFTPAQAQSLIHEAGYYFITFTFVWFVVALVRMRRETPGAGMTDWRVILQSPLRWAYAAIAGVGILCMIAEAPHEKVLYDEHVLESTAMYMHYTRDVSTVVREYEVNGVLLPLTYFLDKRPYFFALLLSFIHDLTGYRVGNVFLLNAGLTMLLLALLFAVVRRLAGIRPGILAVLLLGTLPLLAQNTSGAGMEILNLVMILLSLWLGMLAIERPSDARLGGFILAVVLLAQSRYESSLYVAAAGILLSFIWWRERRMNLPWTIVAAPLLMVPIALLQLVLSANRVMWDLPENLDSRFGLVHLRPNLEHAAAFFSSVSRSQSNSPLLAALGISGLISCGWLVCRRPSRILASPERVVMAVFGLFIMGNLGLLMFYFWGALDDPMVSRLALPFYALLACAAAMWCGFLDRLRPVSRWGIGAVFIALPITFGRATPLHLYSSENLIAAEVRWEKDWVDRRVPAQRLVITNKSSLPWLVNRVPALLLYHARAHRAQLAFHLREGTFDEILVTQRLRATTPDGYLAVDPEDRLPEEYRLEPLIEKRFGATLDRISRLRAITPPPAAPASR